MAGLTSFNPASHAIWIVGFLLLGLLLLGWLLDAATWVSRYLFGKGRSEGRSDEPTDLAIDLPHPDPMADAGVERPGDRTWRENRLNPPSRIRHPKIG